MQMFSSSLAGRSVSLKGGKLAFFFFLFFFFKTYFIFMFVSKTAKRCIWSPNQESHTPPPNSQLSKCLSLWSLPKQALGRAHWTDDPHLKKKKNHFLFIARKNHTNGIFSCHSHLARFCVYLIFWLIFSAARTNASLIKFPHHSPPLSN